MNTFELILTVADLEGRRDALAASLRQARNFGSKGMIDDYTNRLSDINYCIEKYRDMIPLQLKDQVNVRVEL